MALDKFRDPADPIWEQRINQLESAEGVGEITAAKIGKETITGEQVKPAVVGRRLILPVFALFPEKTKGEATKIQYLTLGGAGLAEGTTTVKYGEKVPATLKIEETPYVVTGRTAKLGMEIHLTTNAVAPAANFIFGLYKATVIKGAAKETENTYEAVLAGSTATFAAPPKEGEVVKTKEFAFPAAGVYAIGCEVSAETAASSQETAVVQLFVAYS